MPATSDVNRYPMAGRRAPSAWCGSEPRPPTRSPLPVPVPVPGRAIAHEQTVAQTVLAGNETRPCHRVPPPERGRTGGGRWCRRKLCEFSSTRISSISQSLEPSRLSRLERRTYAARAYEFETHRRRHRPPPVLPLSGGRTRWRGLVPPSSGGARAEACFIGDCPAVPRRGDRASGRWVCPTGRPLCGEISNPPSFIAGSCSFARLLVASVSAGTTGALSLR